MYPPQFLVPFQFQRGTPKTIHEIEYSPKFFVPTVVEHLECNIDRLFNNIFSAKTLAKIHTEPHRLNCMARVQMATCKCIGQPIIRCYIFNNNTQLRTIEHVQNFMQTGINCFFQIVRFYQMLYLQCYVAKNHWQCKILQIARSRMLFCPASFRIVHF